MILANNNVNVVVVSAPSGTGKTTIVKKLVSQHSKFVSSISYTTRAKRANEIDGVDYFFINQQLFIQMANKNWTAWPPAGFYPIDWHAISWTNTDQTGWSIQSDTINLNGAQVTITQNGQKRAVKVNSLAANYGSKFAISMVPQGWTTQPNTTYQVSVKGISQPISYKIQTLDCSQSP